MEAYLDIETSYRSEITVLGIYRKDTGVHQLIWDKITPKRILHILKDISIIYTYNGSRFDLPIIARKTGINLANRIKSHDLMYDCWKRNLYGGLKKVEKILGINRTLSDIDGQKAMDLWELYFNYNDKKALQILLKYNEEDIVNLPILKNKLKSISL